MKNSDSSLYDIVSKIVLTAVGILNLFQDRTSPIPYILLGIVIVIWLFPYLKKYRLKNKQSEKEKKAIQLFSNDFKGFLKQSSPYLTSSSEHLSPFYLRQILWKINNSLAEFSNYVEGIFSLEIYKLKNKLEQPIRDYENFNELSKDFSDILSQFVLIYVDQSIREIKKETNSGKLSPTEIAEIKKRYNDLNRFIGEYNGFRDKVAVFWGNDETSFKIRIPTQVLE